MEDDKKKVLIEEQQNIILSRIERQDFDELTSQEMIDKGYHKSLPINSKTLFHEYLEIAVMALSISTVIIGIFVLLAYLIL